METIEEMNSTDSTSEAGTEPTTPHANNSGHLTGVPGPVVENVGTLDLRTASADEVATLRRVKNVGTLLVAPDTGSNLSGAALENVGSVIEAGPEEQLIVGPSIEFNAESLGTMEDGQKLIVTGIVTFADDATAALVAQKIAKLRLTGILLASKSVQGVLVGRMEHTGVVVTVPKTAGQIVRQMGEKTVTAGYLKYLEPDSVYVNLGETTFGTDIPVEVVQSRIGAYVNVGVTRAPQEVLDYLDARCDANMGVFESI